MWLEIQILYSLMMATNINPDLLHSRALMGGMDKVSGALPGGAPSLTAMTSSGSFGPPIGLANNPMNNFNTDIAPGSSQNEVDDLLDEIQGSGGSGTEPEVVEPESEDSLSSSESEGRSPSPGVDEREIAMQQVSKMNQKVTANLGKPRKRKIVIEVEEVQGSDVEADVQCGICQKEFSNLDDLEEHMDTEHILQQNFVYEKQNAERDRRQKRGKDGMWLRVGKKFECQICKYKISCRSDLKQHMRTHTGERPYPCGICGRAFAVMGNLTTHMRSHTGERPYTCDICGKMFAYANNLKVHARTHTGEKPFVCNICSKAFAQNKHLVEHMKRHDPDYRGARSVECPVCGVSFPGKRPLKKHMKELHLGPEENTCNICNKKFSQKGYLKQHLKIHMGRLQIRCEFCDKGFLTKSDLKRHIVMHTGEKRFKCTLCGLAYAHASGLATHRRRHTGEKPYKCATCGERFFSHHDKMKHTAVHTGEKPYKCDLCGKTFTANASMKEHRRTHTGERPYVCDICNESFSAAGNLRKHKRIHCGDQMEHCSICGKTFSSQKTLAKHMDMHAQLFKCRICEQNFTTAENLDRHMMSHSKDVLMDPLADQRQGVVQTAHNPAPSLHHMQVPHQSTPDHLSLAPRPPPHLIQPSFTSPPVGIPHHLTQPMNPAMAAPPLQHMNSLPKAHSTECLCPICGKKLQDKRVLSGHMMTHTGLTPLQCNVCGLMFVSSEDLHMHMMVHTGQKPYWDRVSSALWCWIYYNVIIYLKISNIRPTKSQNSNASRHGLQLSLCNILKPGLSGEWRCSWSSADRRCSNYIWVINNLTAYKGASYIRDLTVFVFSTISHHRNNTLLLKSLGPSYVT